MARGKRFTIVALMDREPHANSDKGATGQMVCMDANTVGAAGGTGTSPSRQRP